jgi:SulP family sulfate permease
MTIALLAGIESLLCATVADGMIGGRHRSNMELVAQGVANLASPLFGGIPATGAIARTATNVKNGGRTPLAGMVHAATLLGIMLVFGRWAGLIPLCALAAILVVVAYNMSEWRTFRALLRSPRSDVAVLLITFALTVAVDLTVAIQAGMLVALLLFLRNMAESVRISPLSRALREERIPEAEPEVWAKGEFPEGVEVFDVQGPLFFGAAQRFEESIKVVGRKPSAVIVRIREVGHIDATGLHALEQLAAFCRRAGIRFMLAGARMQPILAMERSGLKARMGAENFAPTVEAAVAALRQDPGGAPGGAGE